MLLSLALKAASSTGTPPAGRAGRAVSLAATGTGRVCENLNLKFDIPVAGAVPGPLALAIKRQCRCHHWHFQPECSGTGTATVPGHLQCQPVQPVPVSVSATGRPVRSKL